jgi:hypothetical protein
MLLISVPLTAVGASISGTVKDASGNPIENARIDHTAKQLVVGPPHSAGKPSADEIRSGPKGHFHVVTEVPAIVIRKPGYVSQRLRVTGRGVAGHLGAHSINFTLQAFLAALFQVKDANDIDSTAKWFYIETRDGPQGIISGSGPMYSWGAPDNQKVWTSVEYTEFMDENGVVDASGRSADGTYWRLRTIFGAVAQYYKQTREAAEQLDCVMDRIPRP